MTRYRSEQIGNGCNTDHSLQAINSSCRYKHVSKTYCTIWWSRDKSYCCLCHI